MRIAHLAAEVAPFAKTGGLGDVAGALPKAQAAHGHEVAVWMPLYRRVWEWFEKEKQRPEQALDPFAIDLGFRRWGVGILRTTLPGSTVPLYLIGNDSLFDRASIYGSGPDGRDDGLVRYAVFVRAALEGMRRLQLVPDILHAHDWHACLAPMALRWDAPADWHFGKTKTVLTIHNGAYQGRYGHDQFVSLGLPAQAAPGLDWFGALNLLKGGIVAADAITTVSPGYAREMLWGKEGFGLEPVLRSRRTEFLGLLNGIDETVWDPATDRKIPSPYSLSELAPKLGNRQAMLAGAGMDGNDDSILIGCVGRLVKQKGWDLLYEALPTLLHDGIRFVMLGSGEGPMEDQIRHWTQRAPGRFWGKVGYDDSLAHLIEAGADAFLMPSRFEPCGLNQMYSMAYGTPPIVRRTGGLADTVIGFDGSNQGVATGFVFEEADAGALVGAVRRAARAYRRSAIWTRIARNGMGHDWSWTKAATRYLAVYETLLAR